MIDIHLEEIAKVHEFKTIVIDSKDHDYSWVKKQGDILVTVKCADGVVLVVLLNLKRGLNECSEKTSAASLH